MRILHTESSRVMGGQERRVLAESRGMRDRGHAVWIATPAEGDLAARATAAGLDVIPLSFPRATLPATALRLRAQIARLAPDVVNSHSSGDSWPCALAFAVRPGRCALVRSRHVSAAVRPGALHRFLYGRADHVITTGERVRGDLADTGLVPRDRSTSIPTGVDTTAFRPDPETRTRSRADLELHEDGFVLGAVAYMRSDKGHAVLLRGMPAVLERRPDTVLVLVGDGPERPALQTLAERLGLAGAVRFLGLREDVSRLLPAFDVFCQPSTRNEGVPQAVVQASASGLPVIGTEVGGIPEVVRHGESGLLVAPGDVGALARAAIRLASDPSLRARMGAAGRAHAADAFSIERMLDRTERAYAAALAAVGGRRRS